MNQIFFAAGFWMGFAALAGCAEFSEVVRYGPRASTTEGVNSNRIDERVDARVNVGNHVYMVQHGDTLMSIAEKFHVPDQQISQANLLDPIVALIPGQRLVIPDEAFQNPQEVVGKINEAQAVKSEPVDDSGKSDKKMQFIWPVSGVVTSHFGQRRGRDHDGIDIVAPKGTPVVAVADSEVIYAGRINGYGNIVILKHAGNFFSAYAHLSQYQVKKGNRVRQGQLIGRVGRTGRASAAHLHFEMRYKTRSKDPLLYLPKIEKESAGHKDSRKH